MLPPLSEEERAAGAAGRRREGALGRGGRAEGEGDARGRHRTRPGTVLPRRSGKRKKLIPTEILH